MTIDDVRAAQMCSTGARLWLRQHGFDWMAFLATGIPADQLEQCNDDMANRAIEAAMRRQNGQ